jgi:hypothetical protein
MTRKKIKSLVFIGLMALPILSGHKRRLAKLIHQ